MTKDVKVTLDDDVHTRGREIINDSNLSWKKLIEWAIYNYEESE